MITTMKLGIPMGVTHRIHEVIAQALMELYGTMDPVDTATGVDLYDIFKESTSIQHFDPNKADFESYKSQRDVSFGGR